MEAILNAFIAALNAILALFGDKQIVVDDTYTGDIKGWWESLEITF